MFLSPCKRCPKRHANCRRNQEIRSAVRGLKLGSIKFRCDEHTNQFRPGQRVFIFLGGGLDEFTATGTVMAWSGGRKVQVCVDAPFVAEPRWNGIDDIYQPEKTIKHAIVKIWPDRLKHIGESAPICRNCRKPIGREIPGWKCDKGAAPVMQDVQHDTCVPGDPEQYLRDLRSAEADAWAERSMV